LDRKNLVFLGEIVKAHGRKGELALYPFHPLPRKVGRVYLQARDTEELVPAKVTGLREYKGMFYLRMEGLNRREEAENLKGMKVLIHRIKLPENSYYTRDLMGMELWTDKGKYMGRIIDIMGTGANDIYLIHIKGKEYFFPASKQWIKKIDFNSCRIEVIWPPGLEETIG